MAVGGQHGGSGDIDGQTGYQERVVGGIVHGRLQVGQGFVGKVALVQEIVLVLGHLTLHLHHVGPTLLAKVEHAAGLHQQCLRVAQFLLGEGDGATGVDSINVFLHHAHGLVVAGFGNGTLCRSPVEAGLLEGVPGGTAVEERHRGSECIVVVERGDIIIGVGLRVDVAAPAVLSVDLRRHRGQKVEQCRAVVSVLLLLLERLPSHLGGVLAGVGDAAVQAPWFLPLDAQAHEEAHDEDIMLCFHTLFTLPKACQKRKSLFIKLLRDITTNTSVQ